jgi:hypothetical protein
MRRAIHFLTAAALAAAICGPDAAADTFYVRGDGLGSDSNGGTGWGDAFATLNMALTSVPYDAANDPILSSGPNIIYVQASSGGQAYDVAARSVPYTGAAGRGLDIQFQGGWQNVDAAAAQTGSSLVKDLDGTVDEHGISITGTGHYEWKQVVVNRFTFQDVSRGINLTQTNSSDRADILLTVTDTQISSQGEGIVIDYPKPYTSTTWGGPAKLTASNVDIVAGQGGSGDGVYIHGAWMGSSITADAGKVSTVTSAGGTGLFFSAVNNETHDATFSSLVVYDSAGDGIYLDANRDGTNYYRVQATLENVTVADNAGDGLNMVSNNASSWANVTDSIFADNGGSAILLDNLAGAAVFTLTEDYNDLYNDDLQVNGAAQAVGGNDLTGAPGFYGGTAPYPMYGLAAGSPNLGTDSGGADRGAYQGAVPEPATLALLALGIVPALRRRKAR